MTRILFAALLAAASSPALAAPTFPIDAAFWECFSTGSSGWCSETWARLFADGTVRTYDAEGSWSVAGGVLQMDLQADYDGDGTPDYWHTYTGVRDGRCAEGAVVNELGGPDGDFGLCLL